MDETVEKLETDVALHALARQRAATFLEGKLLRLLAHLDSWATVHFKCRIWHETTDLDWTAASTTEAVEEGMPALAGGGAGAGVAGSEGEGQTAAAMPMQGWSEFVASTTKSDTISISSNQYATSPKGCTVALVDAQVAVLQHALHEARS